ncbi:MAG: hypothetical protein V7739_20170 [Motiliproteus sp.]
MSIFKSLVVMIPVLFSLGKVEAASMEEQVKGAHAVAALCKSYAEKLGRSGDVFTKIAEQSLKIAEKRGYTDNFLEYHKDVSELQAYLDRRLLKEHGSISKIYDGWCYDFYIGLKNKSRNN